MKIAIISDIHTDSLDRNRKFILKNIYEYTQRKDPDVFIIAGDISAETELLEHTLQKLYLESSHCLFIPGNHDLWCERSIDSFSKHEYVLPEICKKNNWIYLPHNPQIIEKIGFVGSCGWYDYSMRSPYFPEISASAYSKKTFRKRTWQDKRFVTFNNMNDFEITQWMKNKLELQLQYFQKNNIQKYIACFHHHVRSSNIQYKNIIDWDFFGAYMGSEEFWKICKKYCSCIGVIEAHSHRQYHYTDTHNIFYCNSPLKYEHEWDSDVSEIVKNAVTFIDIV